MTQEITQIVSQLLDTPKKIIIVGHKNPDGDAVGSCLGLAKYFSKKGHTAHVVMPNDFPNFLKWLPGCNSITIYEKEVKKSTQLVNDADLIFTLDFNALHRAGDLGTLLEAAKAPFVMIDHHQQPDSYPVATYSDVTMSSTAQMVYHFIDALDGLADLDSDIATNLYTGIMTDTGSFRFPATTATTHQVIAHLI